MLGYCTISIENITKCLESIPNNNVKIITILGSDYTIEFMKKYKGKNLINDVVMFDLLVEDYEDNMNEWSNFYAITTLTPYLSEINLFNDNDIYYYKYYGFVTGKLLSNLIFISGSVKSSSFYTTLHIISKNGLKISKQNYINESLYYIKTIDSGYEILEPTIYDIFQKPYNYMYLNNKTTLICNFNDNKKNNNSVSVVNIYYVVILNPPSLHFTIYVEMLLDKMSYYLNSPYYFTVLSVNVPDPSSENYNSTILSLIEKYNPLFIGGKTLKERRILNALLYPDLLLFHIYPYYGEECYTQIYHFNKNLFYSMYDISYYFYDNYGQYFNIISDPEEDEKIYLSDQINSLNNTYKNIDKYYNYYFYDDTAETSICKFHFSSENDALYVSLRKDKIKKALEYIKKCNFEIQPKIVIIKTESMIYYEDYNISNLYFLDSFYTYKDEKKEVDNYYQYYKYFTDDGNEDIYAGTYYAIYSYIRALLSKEHHSYQSIGKILHSLKIPLIKGFTSFSVTNALHLPTNGFYVESSKYIEFYTNSFIHNVPYYSGSTVICDCSTFKKCFNMSIINIGVLIDNKDDPLNALYFMATVKMRLDILWQKNDKLSHTVYNPIFYDISSPNNIDKAINFFINNNVKHILGGINQTYVKVMCPYLETYDMLLWYTDVAYVYDECCRNVYNLYIIRFNFANSIISSVPTIIHKFQMNNIRTVIVTEDSNKIDSTYNEFLMNYFISSGINGNIIHVKDNMTSEEIFSIIINVMGEGGLLILNLVENDCRFLFLLEDYQKMNYLPNPYTYMFLTPTYTLSRKKYLQTLPNIYTYTFFDKDKDNTMNEFIDLLTNFYGEKTYISNKEIIATSAIDVFIYLTESFDYVSDNINLYQTEIFNYIYNIPPEDGISINIDYTFSYTTTVYKFLQTNSWDIIYKAKSEESLMWNTSIKCDYRQTSSEINKRRIIINILFYYSVDFTTYINTLYPYLKERNGEADSKYIYRLNLVPYYNSSNLLDLINQYEDAIFFGYIDIEDMEEIEKILYSKSSVLYYFNYAEPEACSSNIIYMNHYFTTYSLPILYYIENKCSILTILYNSNSKQSVLSSNFFIKEIEYHEVSIYYLININNKASIYQFITINQRLIVQPNCVLNFLDDEFTLEFISVADNYLTYPVNLFTFYPYSFNYPYSSMIEHYVFSNYDPSNKNTVMNTIKEYLDKVSDPPNILIPQTVYTFLAAQILTQTFSENRIYTVLELINKQRGSRVEHPQEFDSYISDSNYFYQPLCVLKLNENNGFSIIDVKQLLLYPNPYSPRSPKICSFTVSSTNKEIKFGYIYSLLSKDVKTNSHKILFMNIMTLLPLKYKFQQDTGIGVSYYIYNVKDNATDCNTAIDYFNSIDVDFLYSCDIAESLNIALNKLLGNGKIIYIYDEPYYKSICNKQFILTELLPNQYFKQVLSYFITYLKENPNVYLLYDSSDEISNEFNKIFIYYTNLFYEVNIESYDISTRNNRIYDWLYSKENTGLVVYLLNETYGYEFLNDLTELYNIRLEYNVVIIPINNLVVSNIHYSLNSKLSIYIPTSYHMNYESDDIFLLAFSDVLKNNIYSFQNIFTGYSILFDVLSNIEDSTNRELFYEYLYGNIFNIMGDDIVFSTNNIIEKDFNMNLMTKNNIIEKYNYQIIIPGRDFDKAYDVCSIERYSKSKEFTFYTVIDFTHSSYYSIIFLEYCIEYLNKEYLEDNIYFLLKIKKIYINSQCYETIQPFFNSNDDVLLVISYKNICNKYINQLSSVSKPFFLISSQPQLNCINNIFINGIFPELYTNQFINYYYGLYINDKKLLFIDPEYISYYEKIIEYYDNGFFNLDLFLIGTDISVLYNYFDNIDDYDINYLLILEQNVEITNEILDYLQSLYCSIKVLSPVTNIITKEFYVSIHTFDFNEKGTVFSKLVYDTYSSESYDMRNIEMTIPTTYTTIRFLLETIKLAGSYYYSEYKPYLYQVVLNDTQFNLRLNPNNHFSKDIIISDDNSDFILPLYLDSLYFNNNVLNRCNLKNGIGIYQLKPLYIGIILPPDSNSLLMIFTLLDRIYLLQETSEYLQDFYFNILYRSFYSSTNYITVYDELLTQNPDISVVFTKVPYLSTYSLLEIVVKKYNVLTFNLDFSVKINSKYFINGGMSMDVYSSLLLKYTLYDSDFFYIIGNDEKFIFYEKLLKKYDEVNIKYELIQYSDIENNPQYLLDEISKCSIYTDESNCAVIDLIKYSQSSLVFNILESLSEPIIKYLVEINKILTNDDYNVLSDVHIISSYVSSLINCDYNYLNSETKIFNEYTKFRYPKGTVSNCHLEIGFSLMTIWMQLVNKTLSYDSNSIVTALYYHEYQSPSGILYISDSNNIERRYFHAKITSRNLIEILDYTSMISPVVYDEKYYISPTYIGVAIDYYKVYKHLSKIMILALTELILDENTNDKQYRAVYAILTHTNNDSNIITSTFKNKVIFIIGCPSSYCHYKITDYVHNNLPTLFFSMAQTEENLCDRNIISVNLPLSHTENITLNYLKKIQISRIIFIYGSDLQSSFIEYISQAMNDSTSIMLYFKFKENDQEYNDDMFFKFYESLYLLDSSTIILNTLKDSTLQYFLKLYLEHDISLVKYTHLLYYYEYYFLDLDTQLTNFILLSSYSGDVRDMSVFLFERYIDNKLGSHIVISRGLATLDCLFKSFIYSYTEARKIMEKNNVKYTEEDIVAYTQILSQSTSLTCALGYIEGTQTNTLSHYTYLSEISQTQSLIKIYPDLSVAVNPYNSDETVCYNGPIVSYYNYDSTTVIFIILIFILFTIIYTIIVSLLVKNKREHVIKSSSLLILLYATFSDYLILVSGTLQGLWVYSDAVCMFYDMFLVVSITNAMCILVLKSWRIHLIYNNNRMKRVRITNSQVIFASLIISLIYIIYAVLSYIIYHPVFMLVIYSTDYSTEIEEVYIRVCSSNTVFNIIQIILLYIVAAFGIYFSWTTRKTDDAYNESKALATSIFFTSIFILAYFCVHIMVIDKPSYRILFDELSLGIAGLLCNLLMVIPKMYKIYYESPYQNKNCLKCFRIIKVFPEQNSSNSSNKSNRSNRSSNKSNRSSKAKIEMVSKSDNV